jgi:hypothetical protein
MTSGSPFISVLCTRSAANTARSLHHDFREFSIQSTSEPSVNPSESLQTLYSPQHHRFLAGLRGESILSCPILLPLTKRLVQSNHLRSTMNSVLVSTCFQSSPRQPIPICVAGKRLKVLYYLDRTVTPFVPPLYPSLLHRERADSTAPTDFMRFTPHPTLFLTSKRPHHAVQVCQRLNEIRRWGPHHIGTSPTV